MTRLTVFKLVWVAYAACMVAWVLTVGMVPFGMLRAIFIILACGGMLLSQGWARGGWSLLVVGATLNLLVQAANGGAMPIAPWCAPIWDSVMPAYRYGGQLWWLGDVLGPCAVTVLSIGDLLVAAGLPIIAVWWVRTSRSKTPQPELAS